ncbi:hypothetical protein OG769_37885 (plasmid) [Streptomyces sp. NBC_01435]|nr:hypothetical protein [Streptomyces sp. NBC_01435]
MDVSAAEEQFPGRQSDHGVPGEHPGEYGHGLVVVGRVEQWGEQVVRGEVEVAVGRGQSGGPAAVARITGSAARGAAVGGRTDGVDAAYLLVADQERSWHVQLLHP